MKFARDWIRLLGVLGVMLCASCVLEAAEVYYWPTPNTAFIEGRGMEHFVQPTVSGRVTSGLFGCVRNNGKRFHEGLDLKPILRDSKGESTDPIYAFCDGVVRYVNRDAKLSSYGRYVVIEHAGQASGLVSLYAHLRSVPQSIEAGSPVRGGEVIATMGRSASYVIPRSRAHLHFEIGLWLGGDFQDWYDAQRFDSENDHGVYNGMNIVGLDVWKFWQAYKGGEVESVMDFVASEPLALVVEAPYGVEPELIRLMPHLVERSLPREDRVGWRIGFTWYGAPIRWEALSKEELRVDRTRVLKADLARLEGLGCDGMLAFDQSAGPRLRSVLSRLFVEKWRE